MGGPQAVLHLKVHKKRKKHVRLLKEKPFYILSHKFNGMSLVPSDFPTGECLLASNLFAVNKDPIL